MARAAQASPDSGLLFLERAAAKYAVYIYVYIYICIYRLCANTLLREKHRVPVRRVPVGQLARGRCVETGRGRPLSRSAGARGLGRESVCHGASFTRKTAA